MRIENQNQLKMWAQSFFLPKRNIPCVFLLEGPVGAGKTHLVRLLGDLMNWTHVSSPTYSIINEYQEGMIHHCDLYRIKDNDELEMTGFWELFNKKSGWIFIEWPSHMEISRIPMFWNVYEIQLSHTSLEIVRHREISL